ncbi:MAG: hypothetical protein JO227_06345 [Acetobacteraceae bacterium]|nr:hypothetical protein [Acetobacteraceae bacterium]
MVEKNTTKSSEDLVPQADKQANANIAQHEGQEGAQARAINQQEADRRKKERGAESEQQSD